MSTLKRKPVEITRELEILDLYTQGRKLPKRVLLRLCPIFEASKAWSRRSASSWWLGLHVLRISGSKRRSSIRSGEGGSIVGHTGRRWRGLSCTFR